MTDLQSQLSDALGATYRIERELGGGGMSRVFLANETALGRQVVIKVLPPEMAAGVNQDRFRREIQLAARLQHPHIVPLLSAGSAGDILYYVMPFIEGESLRVRLAREGELPVTESVRILREVTDALAYAHEQGVVHRDIKPDNIMLSRGHALVTDFGVAKAVSASSGSTMTSLGVALGTPAYMAPEQATADPHVDHRADLYSLGALAYEMLAGRPPFVGGSPQALLAAHVTQSPDRLSAHRSSVPPGLETLVMRCLEKRAADRWQSASELMPHLDSLLTPTSGTHPTTARPAVSSGTASAMRQAHPARVAVLFALASLAALSVTWLLVQRLGLPSWVMPVAVVLLAAGLPIMLLTAKRERERLAAVTTGTHVAPVSGWAGRLLTWRGAITGGGLAFAGLAAGTAAFMGLRAIGVGPFATLVSAGVLTERDKLVLADFANRTSDSTLGSSITEALRIDLSQSPVLRLTETNEVSATLRLMQRNPDAGLDAAAAREVAQRLGAKAVVAGEIVRLGSAFVVSARLVSSADSTTLFAQRETASDAAALIPAVERLSKGLRERIGESLRTIRGGQPLEQVTTSSLAALRAYSEGSRLASENRNGEAVEVLQRAVALDSSFGMAWRRLGVLYWNRGSSFRPQMVAAMSRAYALRDRMPPLEAAHTLAFYANAVEVNRRKAIGAYEQLLASWPDDLTAMNNLAVYYLYERRDEDAARLFRRASTLRPDAAIYRGNLLEVLVTQGDTAAADSVLADWGRRAPGSLSRLRYAARVARDRVDFAKAFALLDSSAVAEGGGGPIATAFLRNELLRWQGHYEAAAQQLREGIALADRQSNRLAYLNRTIDLARQEFLIHGRKDVANRLLDAALVRYPLDSIPALARPYGDLIEVYANLGRVERAQALLTEFERVVPREDREAEGTIYWSRGSLELARGDTRAAIASYQASRANDRCLRCSSFDIARAMEKLSLPDSAIIAYEAYANPPGVDDEGRSLLLAATLRRLGELYESKGDRKKAIEYYGRFVDLWRDADPALQPLVSDVRRHMAELAGEPRR